MQGTGQDLILGVREEDLSQFAIDVINISDKVSDLFSRVDNDMNNLKSFFDCNEYDKLMNSYRTFKKNYSVVKNNINSYSDDLISVINKVRSGDKQISFLIEEITQLASNKAKNIEKL